MVVQMQRVLVQPELHWVRQHQVLTPTSRPLLASQLISLLLKVVQVLARLPLTAFSTVLGQVQLLPRRSELMDMF
tara:strand:- start:87 stop:311 length:225 start_codon:yes stop_codon:yes gene_type:complete